MLCMYRRFRSFASSMSCDPALRIFTRITSAPLTASGRIPCKPEMRNGLFEKTRSFLPLHRRPRRTTFVRQLQHGVQTWKGSPKPSNESIRRGIKSQTTVSLHELQSELPANSNGVSSGDSNGKTYPTVVLQARRNMEKYENCVLLTRVGSFYEVHCFHTLKRSSLMHSPALFRSGREIWPAAQSQSRKEENF